MPAVSFQIRSKKIVHIKQNFACNCLTLIVLCLSTSHASEVIPSLDLAVEQLARFRFPEARRDLSLVRDRSVPGSEVWRRSTYGLAMAYQHEPAASPEVTAQARRLHEELWNRSAGSPEAVHAAIQLGRIAHLRDYYQDRPDLPLARAWYRKALGAGAGDPVAGQAVLYLASAWIEELTAPSFAEAERELSSWVATHPQDPLAAVQWMALADLRHTYLKDPAGAVVALRMVDRLGAPASLRWKVVWRMGAIAQDELKDRETAVACFTAIATRYLRSGKADAARERLRELGVQPPPLPATLWEDLGEPGPIEVGGDHAQATVDTDADSLVPIPRETNRKPGTTMGKAP